jgi:FAD/FMN-containing dehydrogenase
MTSPVTSLQDVVRGRVVLPFEPGWDGARAAWNLTVDQRPAAVVEAASADDVAAVLRAGLRVAPQSTGHGAEALGPLDGTVLLKTSALRGISFDADARTVRVEAGVQAADAAAAAGAHGLAPVLGFATTVGVTGLVVSGGTGWLSRRHGLAASNARAFDVVLASGEQARVDAEHEPELFWALRGGGGRGAVVVAVELELHPLPAVSGGLLAWPAERAAEVLGAFQALGGGAPDELAAAFRYLELPPLDMIPPPLRGRRIAAVITAYLGAHDDAVELLAPLRALDGGLVDTFAPIEPAGLVRLAGDPEAPMPSRGDGFLLRELDDDAVALVAGQAARGALAPLSVLELRLLGGATREPHGDGGVLTGYAASHSVFAGGAAPTPEAMGATLARLAQVRADLAPWTADQVILSAATADRDPVRAFGPAGWERLQRVLDQYDPERRIVGGALSSTNS